MTEMLPEHRDDHTPRSVLLWPWILLGVLVCLAAFVIAALPKGISLWAYRGKTAAEIAEIERFLNTPVLIPEAFQNPGPFSSDLQARFQRVVDEAKRINSSTPASTGSPATLFKDVQVSGYPVNEKAVSNLLSTCSALLDLSGELAADKNFTTALFAGPTRPDEFVSFFTALQAHCIATGYNAHLSQWDQTLSHSLVLRQLLNEALMLGENDGMNSTSLYFAAAAARKTSNVALLRHTITHMPLFRNVEPLVEARGIDIAYRELRREGYPVSLESGMAFYRASQAFYAAKEEFPEWKLSRLPGGHPDRPHWESMKNMTYSSGIVKNRAADRIIQFLAPRSYMQFQVRDMGVGWLRGVEKQVAATKTRTSLVMLALATRLMELEESKLPTNAQDLKPTYLDSVPSDDLTTGGAFRWHAVQKKFYSIGPDGVDDDLKVLYDPESGPLGKGDFAL